MEKHLRASILFLTIMMFWEIIYPQYALTEDMYRVKAEGKTVAQDCPADYGNIMTAKRGEVTVRFALLEKIEEFFGEKECDECDRE